VYSREIIWGNILQPVAPANGTDGNNYYDETKNKIMIILADSQAQEYSEKNTEAVLV